MSVPKSSPFWSTESVFICYFLGVVLMYAILGLFTGWLVKNDSEKMRHKI